MKSAFRRDGLVPHIISLAVAEEMFPLQGFRGTLTKSKRWLIEIFCFSEL